MTKLSGLIDIVKDAIDNGATSVEEVQKAIMNQPIEVLKKIEILEKPSEAVEEIQNRTIGSVYNVIRTVNHEVARLAKGLLGQGEEEKRAG